MVYEMAIFVIVPTSFDTNVGEGNVILCTFFYPQIQIKSSK